MRRNRIRTSHLCFQRFYPGSKRMSITPDFIRFFFLLCARVVRLAFLFLLFRGIKSRKFYLSSPNLTKFSPNICIYQKKALPLHSHLAYRTDGEPTVNRQSRLTSSLCQAKNEPILVQYLLYYIFIYNIQFNTLFMAEIDPSSAINMIHGKLNSLQFEYRQSHPFGA